MSATQTNSVSNFISDVTTTSGTTSWTNCAPCYTWTPSYWYTQDKATVAFRVVKKLIDLKVINEDKLTIKKFIQLVDELVKTL